VYRDMASREKVSPGTERRAGWTARKHGALRLPLAEAESRLDKLVRQEKIVDGWAVSGSQKLCCTVGKYKYVNCRFI